MGEWDEGEKRGHFVAEGNRRLRKIDPPRSEGGEGDREGDRTGPHTHPRYLCTRE